ncbi:hypothetical protein ACFQY4_32445 [Catellatospora bangladeshensis]|uniref:hypothetical protein n=1 Tax=Catellatospora bangladeshensis TaxID=310355 RepID=UPI00360C537A
MRLARPSLALAAGLAVALLSATPAAAVGPVPNSMASMGDSITRGFNACGWYSDCTDRSFSTGGYASVSSTTGGSSPRTPPSAAATTTRPRAARRPPTCPARRRRWSAATPTTSPS